MFIVLSVTILLAIIGASAFKVGRSFLAKQVRWIFIAGVGLTLVFDGAITTLQYWVWQHDGVAKFLLPPYGNIGYFLEYAARHFFAPSLVALLFALIVLSLAIYFNKKNEEKFFHPEEPYFAALAIFLVNYPALLLYVIIVLILPTILQFASSIVNKSVSGRLSLYHLWFPLALFAILLNELMSIFPWWKVLAI